MDKAFFSSAPEIEDGETEDRDFTHELYYCADDEPPKRQIMCEFSLIKV